MNKEDLWKVYDSNYANNYNEIYLTNPFSQFSTHTELTELNKIINEDTEWLDLGCGTGYMLSQFPETKRAGLDISPDMLTLARAANPGALFFQEADFRNDIPEWHNRWSLLTCMWGAYCYLDSVREIEQLIDNMVKWTKTGGTIFLPVVDLEDLRPNTILPYELKDPLFRGSLLLTGVTWTWIEEVEGQRLHEHLVSPPAEHFIKLLEPFFDNIEVVRYPPYMNNWVSRKAILATGRRSTKNAGQPASVVWQHIPEAAVKSPEQDNYAAFRASMSPLSNKLLLSELFFRTRSGFIFKALAKKLLHKVLKK